MGTEELRAKAWAEFQAALESEAKDWERAVAQAMRERHGPTPAKPDTPAAGQLT